METYPPPLLEVCVENTDQVKRALLQGANRIELCSDLHIGGMSPTVDLIHAVISEMDTVVSREVRVLPLQIMVRSIAPSFVYNAAQIAEMENYIHQVKLLNEKLVLNQQCDPEYRRQGFISGFVFGCLCMDASELMADSVGSSESLGHNVLGVGTNRWSINEEQTSVLIHASRPHMVTFHRAFDEVYDKIKALYSLKSLEVDRILTSGGIGTVDDNMDSLCRLIALSGSSTLNHTNLSLTQDSQQAPKPQTADLITQYDSSVSLAGSNPALKSIIVMPGGGVRSHNARQLLDMGAIELHSSTPFFLSAID